MNKKYVEKNILYNDLGCFFYVKIGIDVKL